MLGHGHALPETPDGTERPRNPWHNEQDGDAQHPQEAVETPDISPSESHSGTGRATPTAGQREKDVAVDGTWGERDAGAPSPSKAMGEFEELRQTLTSMSKTHSRSQSRSERPDGLAFLGPLSRLSTRRTLPKTTRSEDETDQEAGADGAPQAGPDDDFELGAFMKEGHFEKRKDGQSAKKVGVVWKDLTVKGTGPTSSFVKTLPDAILGTFGPDLYQLLCRFFPFFRVNGHAETRTLINSFSGVLRDGQMMLVLGRPGAGCSTFLRAIANDRETFAGVQGHVSYGGMDAKRQKKHFKGEVNYNPEDDVHFATLNVWQTLLFALMNKTRKGDKGEIPVVLDALLKMFGISHTKQTLVGNEFVRGISGGERKRVRRLVSFMHVLTC